MEQINLNLIPNGVNPVAHCKQYDVGRTFRCNLFEGSSVYTLDGTETVECEVHKPDGNLVTLALSNTGSTYVDVVTTLQMCACSGESLAAIKITSGGVEIGSLNFVLNCERSPLEGGITSDSGIYNLETQVTSLVASEVADQYDSANVIFDAEPTAGHGNGYAVTSEGIVSALEPTATIENVSIASFDDGGDGVPVKELVVGIEPVQASGTPTPDSPLAITGWTDVNATVTGKNLIRPFRDDETTKNGITVTPQADGSIRVHGTSSSQNSFIVSPFPFSSVLPAGTYTFGLGNYSNYVYAQIVTSEHVFFARTAKETYTLNNSATISRLDIGVMASAYNVYIDVTVYPQVELGSTATTYEAYNGTTTTISLGQTVYGGELNVTTGELTITHGFKTLTGDASESWNVYSPYNGFWLQIDDMESGTRLSGLCNRFETTYTSAHTTNSIWFGVNNARIFLVECSATTGATVSDLRTWLASNNVEICYPLATPTTVTLTPTEVATVLGYNNIYADTGDVVSVTYIKDFASAIYPTVSTTIGDLADLTTTDKSSVVNAINELDGEKVSKLTSGTKTIFGTWTPAFNGRCYMSMYVPTTFSSITNIEGYYSTDGTTWVSTSNTSIGVNNGIVTIETTTTACAGRVGKIILTIS